MLFRSYWGADRFEADYDDIRESVDEFICIEKMQDDQVVSLCRGTGFHVAIDLAGHTQNSRTSLFARRLAPIQMSWIGFLGTMGHKSYDYLVADFSVLPKGSEKFYDEKIIRLPCFQTNMHQVTEWSESDPPPSGKTTQNQKIVFSCFNNGYKINPICFGMWAEILKELPESELWLNDEHELFKRHINQEALRQGLSPDRIRFKNRLPLWEYLDRYHEVDIALDTFPYNGGVTSTDALSRGVPLVSLFGQSFQSRMGLSFLSQLQVEYLSCADQESYIRSAIRLGSDAEFRSEARRKTHSAARGSFLFDHMAFRDCLEAALCQAVKLFEEGREPENFSVTLDAHVELQSRSPHRPQQQ